MAKEERGGSEIADSLQPVYDQAEMRAILGTVRWRPDLDQELIARRIERAAWWLPAYRRLWVDEEPPSKRERRLRAVLRKLRAAAEAARNVPLGDRGHLEAAAMNLAMRDGRLPDVLPEPVEMAPPRRPESSEPQFMNVWDAASQIDAILDRLDWLVRCFERAVERTTLEKASHGSPVADEPLHAAITALHDVYFECAEKPRTPGADIGDESADSRTWRKGELLDFLEAALRPLGVRKTREALYADWRRATKGQAE